MGREILFKAKRTDNGEWITGYYFRANHHWHNHGIHEDWLITNAIQNGGWCNVCSKYAIDRTTLCQYTGLTDKNGNKIWENDVVVMKFYDCWGEGFIKYSKEKARFVYYEFEDDYYSFDDTCDIEVIGNIFDNPELMKEE